MRNFRLKNHHITALFAFALGVAAFGVQYDLYYSTSATASLKPAAYTSATNNGAGVDLKGYGSATVIIPFGVHTDGTHKIQLEESTDNASFSTVSSSEILGSTVSVADATNDDQVYSFGYLGDARYVRVVSKVSSATSGAIYGGVILRGHPRTAPVN